jgi:hypothetical protein
MTVLRVAAVQASYALMDRDATIDRVAALTPPPCAVSCPPSISTTQGRRPDAPVAQA